MEIGVHAIQETTLAFLVLMLPRMKDNCSL